MGNKKAGVGPYFQPPNSGPKCSTPRSAALRKLRFEMAFEKRTATSEYEAIAEGAMRIFLETEDKNPALARAKALRYAVESFPLEIDPATVLLGGENPFFFNILFKCFQADGCSRSYAKAFHELYPKGEALAGAGAFTGPGFGGHITPGFEFVLGLGISGLRRRIEEHLGNLRKSSKPDRDTEKWYEAALFSCDTILLYARRYHDEARHLAELATNPQQKEVLLEAAAILQVVPENPAETFHQALQAYWLVHILGTLEMGGLNPGGGCGLGRPDQYLYPYYARDMHAGRLTREKALELIEIFLLCFRHEDYYTWHQQFTPGCQASIGGVTPTELDASNELTEIIMEASLRIAMPAPYISIRLHRDAPERFWQAVANYVLGGLGFPVVNDEVLIPAFLRHGRSLYDARDYICACCYEPTIPGREIYHPSGIFFNLPLCLELALNEGCLLPHGSLLGVATPGPDALESMDAVWQAFRQQIHYALENIVELSNYLDEEHSRWRRYPLMSLFFDECAARGMDVCAGGARYNLMGCVVNGIPNVVNSLAAIEYCVFEKKTIRMTDLAAALRINFVGYEDLQRHLLQAPKWGNDDWRVDKWAIKIADTLYDDMAPRLNGRGGRWQLALYSFVSNVPFGERLGASADGRKAGEILTRNMDPAWGTDSFGPTAILNSMSKVDWTKFPDGSALDLRFDPAPLITPEGREKFVGFLKAFVNLKVMQIQVSMADTETLLDAREHPDKYPNLMVKVAGYSARFVEISDREQDEIIGRSMQRI